MRRRWVLGGVLALALSACSSTPASSPASSSVPTPAVTSAVKPLVPVRWFQFDERWAKQSYGVSEKDTVRRWGCGPAAMAMAVATLRDPSVDPSAAAAWSLQHGMFTHAFASGKTKSAFFTEYAAEYGVRVWQINDADLRTAPAAEAEAAKLRALKAVREGDWVIVLLGKGHWTTEGHFVLWYGVDGSDVLVADSNSTRENKARNTFARLSQTMIRLWVVDVDRDEPVQ